MHRYQSAPGNQRLRLYIVLALCLGAWQVGTAPASMALLGFHKDEAPAAAQDDAPDPNDPLTVAQQLLNEKRYPEALQAYKAIYLSNPTSPDVSLGLAFISERTGDLTTAIKYATQATNYAPKSPQTHIALAHYLDENRDAKQASLQYMCAADLKPPEATMEKIFSPALRLLLATDDKEEALKVAKKWAKQYSKLPECQYNYAWILSQCGGEKSVPEAIETYQRALELDPKLAGTHYNLALLFLRLKQPDDAVKELQHFLKAAPDDADAPQAKKLLSKIENAPKQPTAVNSSNAEKASASAATKSDASKAVSAESAASAKAAPSTATAADTQGGGAATSAAQNGTTASAPSAAPAAGTQGGGTATSATQSGTTASAPSAAPAAGTQGSGTATSATQSGTTASAPSAAPAADTQGGGTATSATQSGTTASAPSAAPAADTQGSGAATSTTQSGTTASPPSAAPAADTQGNGASNSAQEIRMTVSAPLDSATPDAHSPETAASAQGSGTTTGVPESGTVTTSESWNTSGSAPANSGNNKSDQSSRPATATANPKDGTTK